MPCAEQVGVDIRQEERGGDDLAALAGDQFGEDVLDGGDDIRLDAGDPVRTHILSGQALADEQHVGLGHVIQEFRRGNFRIDIGHLDDVVEQKIGVGRVFARLGIRRDADDDRVDPGRLGEKRVTAGTAIEYVNPFAKASRAAVTAGGILLGQDADLPLGGNHPGDVTGQEGLLVHREAGGPDGGQVGGGRQVGDADRQELHAPGRLPSGRPGRGPGAGQ